MDEDAIALLTQIGTAFDGVPRPSITTKSVARGRDDEYSLTDERQRFLYAQDPETRWQDLTDEQLLAYNDIIPFLDQEGIRFYLPAFMGHELRQHSGIALQAIIMIATAWYDQLKLLTEDQMRCLIDFLTYHALHEDGFDADDAALAVDALEFRLQHGGLKTGS